MADEKTATASSKVPPRPAPGSIGAAAQVGAGNTQARPQPQPAPAVRRPFTRAVFAKGTIIHGEPASRDPAGNIIPGKRHVIHHGQVIPQGLMSDKDLMRHVNNRTAISADGDAFRAPVPSVQSEERPPMVQDEQGNWIDSQGSTHDPDSAEVRRFIAEQAEADAAAGDGLGAENE